MGEPVNDDAPIKAIDAPTHLHICADFATRLADLEVEELCISLERRPGHILNTLEINLQNLLHAPNKR